MSAIFTKEADNLVNKFLFTGYDLDRGVSLEMGLYSNASFAKAPRDVGRADLLVLSPDRNPGYATKTLSQEDILVSKGDTKINLQVFDAADNWQDPVAGYFISTTGAVPRLLFYFFETGRIVNAGSKYEVLFTSSVG